jgi:hypothetical protein
MSVFVCFFAFFGAKIRPAAAGTGELGWDLRDQTRRGPVLLAVWSVGSYVDKT